MAMSPHTSIYRGLGRRLLGNDDTSPFSGSALRQLPYAAVAIPLLIAHLALSQLGWILIAGGPLTPVWPAAGLDLVVVLVFGPRFWPVLLAAYFITNSSRSTLTWAPALGMAVSNVLRALASAWLYKAISNTRKFLGHLEEVAAIGGTALLSPLLSAGVGTAVLILTEHFPAAQWGLVSSRWWTSDALG